MPAAGIGLITTTALAVLIPDPKFFDNGRHFAAWLGITPREDSTSWGIYVDDAFQCGRNT